MARFLLQISHMAMNLDEITEAARQLRPEERELLMHRLADELPDAEQERIEALWRAELRSRHEARERGEISSRPVEAAVRDIRAKLNARGSD